MTEAGAEVRYRHSVSADASGYDAGGGARAGAQTGDRACGCA